MAKALAKGSRITGHSGARSHPNTPSGTRAGESIRKIAADAGRSYGFVHGVLKESGADLARPRRRDPRREEDGFVGAEVDGGRDQDHGQEGSVGEEGPGQGRGHEGSGQEPPTQDRRGQEGTAAKTTTAKKPPASKAAAKSTGQERPPRKLHGQEGPGHQKTAAAKR